MCYPGSTLVSLQHLEKRRGWHLLRATLVAEATGGGSGGGGGISGGGGGKLKQCMCSPTSHPGSFRCRHHQAEYVWGGRRRLIQAAAASNNIYNFKVTQRKG